MSASLEHVTDTIRSAKFAALDIVQEFLLLERLVDYEDADVPYLVGNSVDAIGDLVLELTGHLTDLVKP